MNTRQKYSLGCVTAFQKMVQVGVRNVTFADLTGSLVNELDKIVTKHTDIYMLNGRETFLFHVELKILFSYKLY